MTCLNCLRGYHSACRGCSCLHQAEASVPFEEPSTDPEVGEGKLQWKKDDSKVRDEFSTGRKRAARLYPLDRSAPCEWRGKENCGGGKFPIKGCSDGKQQCRHHGPDKNTLNNSPGNVHRICHADHNRWHAANDLTYNIDDSLETD